MKEKKRKKMIMGLERQTVLTLTPVADSKTVSNLPQKKIKNDSLKIPALEQFLS